MSAFSPVPFHRARAEERRRPVRWLAAVPAAVLLVAATAASALARPSPGNPPPCFGVTYDAQNRSHYLYPNAATTYDAQGFAIVDLRTRAWPMVVFADPVIPVRAKVYGTGYSDRICTGALGDRVWAGNGNDRVDLGPGNDRGYGQAGSDSIEGGRGNDVIQGGGGNDYLLGDRPVDDPADYYHKYQKDPGNRDRDRLFGGPGRDEVRGAWGDDLLRGGADWDRLHGGAGDDRLFGDGGADQLHGGAGNDVHFGGAGNDSMYGFEGDDCYDGGDGDLDLAEEGFVGWGVDRANDNVEIVRYPFHTIEHGGPCT